MPFNLRLRLSAMMFLQWAIPGAFAPVAYIYWQKIGFSDTVIGNLAAVGTLFAILAPVLGGQVADRWFPTQYFLAAIYLAGGVFLLIVPATQSVLAVFIIMGFYSLLAGPTGALTNSLAFHHLREPDREFGTIRVFGTLGWIVAGLALTFWRHYYDPEFQSLLGSFRFDSDWFARLWTQWWSAPGQGLLGDLFYLAGGLSLALGVLCFLLPHTPPKKSAQNPLAFMAAFKLMRDRNFLVFIVIAFVVTTELQFYYIPTSGFLKDIGIAEANVPSVMTIAQIAEIFTMWLLLPVAIKRLGIRWTLAIGVIAWPLRYVCFAIGEPVWLVVASLAFHGLGFTFFFVVSQIYVNKVATADIRASAQSMLFVVQGLGGLLGTQIFTVIKNLFTEGTGPAAVTNWTYLFLVPCALTTLCAVAYLVLFKPPEKQLAAEPAA